MRLKLIANPAAGGDARKEIARAQACLQRRGCTVDLTLTGARGDAERAAAAAKGKGYDRVVACGGDGTLCEVINGLAPSNVPLAFLPLGTTNVFALEAGIPFDVEGACAVALDGEPRPICLGEADGTRFLLMAGIGFDAEVVRGVDLRLKRRVGKFAYLFAALAALLRRPPAPVEMCLEDGTPLRGYGAVIGNGRLYGGRFSVTPEASLAEAALDVCLFLKPGRLALLRCAARVAAGARLEAPDVRVFKTGAVTVHGTDVPVQIDGDYLGPLPMTFRAKTDEIIMMLPGGKKRTA